MGKEAHKRGAERFKAADKNGDGMLDREEAKSMPKVAKNFDAIDADKNGTVTGKEIHDYMKAHQRGAQEKLSGHGLRNKKTDRPRLSVFYLSIQ